MKIAVFGWYGHNNAGDERIKFCLNHFLMNLGGIEAVDFFDLHENAIKGKTRKFDVYDLIIIGGGGLILSQSNYHNFIRGINTKIVTLGISVETKLTGNPKEFALALLEKSLIVLVRDMSSAQKLSVLDPSKKIQVSADLTFLEPYSTVMLKNTNSIGINLLPKPKDFQYATLALQSFSFFIRQFARFGVKNIVRIFDFKPIVAELENKFRLLPIPFYCDVQKEDVLFCQKNDIEFLKQYFSNVPSVFSDQLIDDCDAFLSMRLHGSIFAVQKGIPIVSFAYLPKNKNFMNAVGLEKFVVDSGNAKEIFTLIENAIEAQEIMREKMATFKEKATIKIKKDLTDIMNLIR